DPHELAVDAVRPAPEVMYLAPDLLLPGAARMGRKGEIGIRLIGPVGRFTGVRLSSRIRRHGATSAAKGKVASPPAGHDRRGQLSLSVVYRVVKRKESLEKPIPRSDVNPYGQTE